jgi:hypothetical protein
MRLIDANTIISKEKVYGLIPQPMIRYDNYEEFSIDMSKNNIQFRLATSFPELLIIFRDLQLDLSYRSLGSAPYGNGSRTATLLDDKNIWIKTVDKFIPDVVGLDGEIHYAIKDSIPIPTDGCYIKLCAIMSLPYRIVGFTSTGVNSFGISKWNPTGAVRSQFLQELSNKIVGTGARYQESLERMRLKKKPNVDIYKFLFAFLHPNSTGFLKVNKARALSFGNKIKADDSEAIFQSQMFRQAMIQVTKMMIPELKKVARERFPVTAVVEMLGTAYDKASSTNGSVKEILEVMDKAIAMAGYEEEVHTQDDRPQLPSIGSLSNSNTGKPLEIPATPIPTTVETLLDDPLEVNEEILKELRNITNSLDSFVQLDAETEEIEKQKNEEIKE